MSSLIELRNVTFGYPERPLFKDFHFRILEGQRLGLMGPNGAGKTTLLRLLVGLEKPFQGELLFRGKVCSSEKDLRVLRRHVGLVFQDPDDQLFCPTVGEDLAFGPLNLGLPRQEVKRRVKETLSLLELEDFEEKVTYRLSGGEKRLVALGTVLTMKPSLLLLDEPTGDLDPRNIQKLERLLPSLGSSYLIVSHDQQFLQSVCDEIFWLEDGRLKRLTSPVKILTKPSCASGASGPRTRPR